MLQCRLNNTLCLHWSVISFFVMHPITHWTYSAVCCVWCFLLFSPDWFSMNTFGCLVRSRMCFTDHPPGCSHSKCQLLSVSTQPAFPLLCEHEIKSWCTANFGLTLSIVQHIWYRSEWLGRLISIYLLHWPEHWNSNSDVSTTNSCLLL